MPEEEVRFADLGLYPDREYLVFEFWEQTFTGRFKGAFTVPAQDADHGVQLFVIREARPHPWILSTTRHISQGGVSLSGVKWAGDSKTLSGASKVVVEDPYVLTIHVPDGFRLATARVNGLNAEMENRKNIATVRVVPRKTGTVNWRLTFEQRKSNR